MMEEKKGLHCVGYCLFVVEDDPSVFAKRATTSSATTPALMGLGTRSSIRRRRS